MSEIKELKRFIYSATVTSGSGSQSFYIDAESREEADKRAANNESDGMYADDSEVTDLDALDYEDETTVDDFGDFPLISREQSLIAQLEAAQKERDDLKELNCHFDLSIRKTEGVNEVLRSKLEAAERALIRPLPISELVHRLEGQTYEKWFSESDVKDLRERAQKAEATLSAANEKLQVPAGYCIMPESLTAENGAKGALSGEFFTETDITCEHCNDLGVQTVRTAIGWSTIKDIYKMAVSATAIHQAGFTVEEDAPIVIAPAPAGVIMRPQFEKPLERCAAGRDGECHHKDCPQLRDNEPMATGRHCPIDNWDDE